MKIETTGNSRGAAELDKKMLYKLTRESGQQMQNSTGQVIEVDFYAVYFDADKKTGEDKRVLSIRSKDGDIFNTISNTAIESFLDIVDVFTGDGSGDEIPGLEIYKGTAKSGRPFVDVRVAG